MFRGSYKNGDDIKLGDYVVLRNDQYSISVLFIIEMSLPWVYSDNAINVKGDLRWWQFYYDNDDDDPTGRRKQFDAVIFRDSSYFVVDTDLAAVLREMYL